MSEAPRATLKAEALFDMTGRVAVVTGGGSGIGKAIARAFVENGARVVLSGQDRGQLAQAVADLSAGLAAGYVTFAAGDVRDDAAVAAMFDHAHDAHGGVDVLVNNAGIGHRGRADDTTREVWDDVFDVNCSSAFMVAQEAATRMRAGGRGGAIVNVGSILQSRVMRNVCAYAASKAALDQMTRSLALEWARDGIRVNALVPGWFETAMTVPFLGARGASVMAASNPMRRLGLGDDLAGAALLLASDAGAYITGASIVVDGGQALV